MNAIYNQRLLAVLAWIVIVSATAVDLVPLGNYEYGGLKAGYTQTKGNWKVRSPRSLGNGDITKLLDDLDNQTEAIKNGQEIGDELFSEKLQTRSKEENLNNRNNSFTSGVSQNKSHMLDEEEVTDSTSQAVSISEAPALVDIKGVPEKTTAIESGESYLTGKPLLVLNKEDKDPDVNKWFLYYPLATESDKQIP